MKADEIREMSTGDCEYPVEAASLDQQRNQTCLLREIAAQLAELNETLRVQSALLAGEGSPQ